ncbi:MAG: T9SS type A sorting domain-containing protein [Bacteroidota bacterium]
MKFFAICFSIIFLLIFSKNLTGKSYHHADGNHCLYFNKKIPDAGAAAMCDPPSINFIVSLTSYRFWPKWDEIPTATHYEFELGLAGFEPGTGEAVASAQIFGLGVLIDDLLPDTEYEMVIRAYCPAFISDYSEPFAFTTSPLCGGSFYDLGGPNEHYPTNLSFAQTFCPDQPGGAVSLHFDTINIAACCDTLAIYDGPTVDYSLLTLYQGGNMGTIEAENPNGCLTLEFISHDTARMGWEGSVSCVECVAPGPVSVEYVPSFRLVWPYMPAVDHYDLEIGIPGFAPATGSAVLTDELPTSAFYSVSQLESNTAYEAYVRRVCSSGAISAYSGPYLFVTPPLCDDLIYDLGGPDDDFPNEDFSYDICPGSSGYFFQLEFIELDIDSCCAELTVTESNNNVVVIPLDGTLPEPIPIGRLGGCLSLDFTVLNDQGGGAGWEAAVRCVDCLGLYELDVEEVGISYVGFTWEWPHETPAVRLDWFIVPAGTGLNALAAEVSGTTDDAATTGVTAAGLVPDTEYELYFRTLCGSDTLGFVAPVRFKTAPTCGQVFYDPGGPDENFAENEFKTKTIICPDQPGQAVELDFQVFDILPSASLIINHRPSTWFWSASDLSRFTNLQPPGKIVSYLESGCMEISYLPGNIGTQVGWEAAVNCLSCPPVGGLRQFSFQPDLGLKWNSTPNAKRYYWEVGTIGFEPGTGNYVKSGYTAPDTTSRYMEGLLPNTYYELYVQTECDSGQISYFSEPFLFYSGASCGSVFYDPGGPNNAYRNNDRFLTVICPETPEQYLTIDFAIFNSQDCCDILHIFTSEDFPDFPEWSLSGSFSGAISAPDRGECLFLEFAANETLPGNGWEAHIQCSLTPTEEAPAVVEDLRVFPSPTSSALTVAFQHRAAEELTIEVIDVTGRTMQTRLLQAHFGNNRVEMNFSEIPAGLYLVALKGTSGRAVRRVVKK